MELVGKIIKIFDEKTSANGFVSRDFAVQYVENDKYEQTPLLSFLGDKTSILDKFDVGDEVKIQFNIRGKKYTKSDTGEDMFFTSLTAWKIEKLNESSEQKNVPKESKPAAKETAKKETKQAPPAKATTKKEQPIVKEEESIEDSDDLPF